MHNLEFNKIFAAVLVAGIVAMLAVFVAKKFVSPHHLHEDAVAVESLDDSAGAAAAGPAGPDPVLALLATADVTKGEKVAKACAACHTFEKGGKDGVGPHLWGMVNRKKDSVGGFAYSGELSKVGGASWSYEELNKFLWKPKAYASGTKMNFIGIKKPEDRAAVIAYLRTLADAPAALPDAGRIAAEAAELAPPEAAAPAATDTAPDTAASPAEKAH